MDYQVLKNQLFQRIGIYLEKYSFRTRHAQQSFEKKTHFGKLCIHLSFVPHRDVGKPVEDFDVAIDVAIRFDDLEQLVHDNDKLLSEREKKETCSIGVELGNFSEGKYKYWAIAREEDITITVPEILTYINSVGLPYLEKYSNIETALDALAGDDRESWLHCPLHDWRAKKAIGLAFLLGKKDLFEQLITQKKIFLEKINDRGLNSFLEFAGDLKRRWGQNKL